MRIVSWNVNGLRAACRKGFLDWLKTSDADIICLQEVKGADDDLPWEAISRCGYDWFANPAAKKGYAGVAVVTRRRPARVRHDLEHARFDVEGRALEVEYPQFTLLNLYLPHGGRAKEHLPYKLDAYRAVLDRACTLVERPALLLGDFNVAHTDIDLARPRQNRNNTMFTSDERACLTALVEQGWIDSYRLTHATERAYTWWPWSFDARARNLGWRIDYAFVSPVLWGSISQAFIANTVHGSDHCPIGLELRGTDG